MRLALVAYEPAAALIQSRAYFFAGAQCVAGHGMAVCPQRFYLMTSSMWIPSEAWAEADALGAVLGAHRDFRSRRAVSRKRQLLVPLAPPLCRRWIPGPSPATAAAVLPGHQEVTVGSLQPVPPLLPPGRVGSLQPVPPLLPPGRVGSLRRVPLPAMAAALHQRLAVGTTLPGSLPPESV